MTEAKMGKVADDHPNRCQSVFAHGQCQFQAAEGSKFCVRHGANNASQNYAKQSLRNYRLAVWKERVNEFADSEQATSLREEIGILRLLLEETVNRCHDRTDLMIYNQKITDLVMKIDKVVVSAHKLEQSLGLLLDKTTIMNLADQLSEIINEHIEDKELVAKIGDRIVNTIIGMSNESAISKLSN